MEKLSTTACTVQCTRTYVKLRNGKFLYSNVSMSKGLCTTLKELYLWQELPVNGWLCDQAAGQHLQRDVDGAQDQQQHRHSTQQLSICILPACYWPEQGNTSNVEHAYC